MLGAGALGQLRGIVWGGRREEGSGWETRVYSKKISGLQVMRGEAQTHFIQNEDSDIEEDSTLSGLRNKTNLQL